VHDTESLGAQVLTLKKELAASRAENTLLRVSKERMEAELRRAEHEGEQALRSGGLVDGLGPAAARPEVRLLKSLKARTRELQEELQSKEAQISELTGQAKGIRVKELEVQAKVYLDEARRLKELFELQARERAEAEQALRDEHAAALGSKEQQLEALRQDKARLKKQNAALDEELGRWMDENEMLRDKVLAAEGPDAHLPQEIPSAATASSAELAQLRAKVKELQTKLKAAVRDKERLETDKLSIFSEMNEAVQGLEVELKQEKAKVRKLDKLHKSADSELAIANARLISYRNKQPPLPE